MEPEDFVNDPQPFQKVEWNPVDFEFQPSVPILPVVEFPARITDCRLANGKLYVETEGGFYEMLEDGSCVGVTF